jgi:hypothetical protein
VKWLAALLVILAVGLTARAALAHPDTLGAPDPYWQQIANASTGGSPQVATGDATASRPAALPRLRRFVVYGSGIAFAVFAASLLRALLGSTRRPRL